MKVTPRTATTSWRVSLPWASTITAPWDGRGSVRNGVLTVKNERWNGSIAAGQSTSFGFRDTSSTGMPRPATCTAALNGVVTPCIVTIVGTR